MNGQRVGRLAFLLLGMAAALAIGLLTRPPVLRTDSPEHIEQYICKIMDWQDGTAELLLEQHEGAARFVVFQGAEPGRRYLLWFQEHGDRGVNPRISELYECGEGIYGNNLINRYGELSGVAVWSENARTALVRVCFTIGALETEEEHPVETTPALTVAEWPEGESGTAYFAAYDAAGIEL